MKPEDFRKSPYEAGGKRPDRTMPSDRQKKADSAKRTLTKPKPSDSNTVTYIIKPDTSGWASGGVVGASLSTQLQYYARQMLSSSGFSLTVGPDSREKEFASLGFAAGVVRGVRSFLVDDLGRLTGVAFKKVWMPGENLAKCYAEDRKEFGDYAAHLPECVCGFYGYYDGSNDYRDSGKTITGVVEGYGSTVIGSRGFRCAKARIVALHIPDDMKRSGVVARNYAEIPMFDTFLRMVQEFPPIGDEKTSKPTDDDFWTREA